MNRELNVSLTATLTNFEQGMVRATAQLAQLGRAAGQASEQLASRIDRGSSSALSSLTKLSGGVLSVTAAFSALKQGLQIASTFQRMDTAIKAVSTSTADYAQTQRFLQSASDRYGLSIEALSQSYVGFKANTNDTILKGAEAERIFLSVAKASAALQLSTEDTTGTLRAFGQMLSKGTVMSEELKGQVGERLFGAFQMAARAMSTTTQGLNKMLQSGEVLAVDLLPKLATELDKSFGDAALENVNTMAGGWTRATDQLKLFIAEFSKTSGIDLFFTKIGNGTADYLKGIREAVHSKDWLVFFGGYQDTSRRIGQLSDNATKKQEFAGMDPGKRQARIELLQDEIASLQKKLSERANTVFGGGKAEFTSDLSNAKNLLAELNRINGQMARDEHIKRDFTFYKAPTKSRLDIDDLKKKKDTLGKQIDDGNLNHEDVSKLQAEYDRLTRQIDGATASTKKHKAYVDSQSVSLTTNENILKRLTQRYKETGENGTQVALFKQLVDIDAWKASNKSIDLGDKSKTIETIGRVRDVLLKTVAPLQQVGGLFDRFNDVLKVNTLAGYNEEINKLQANITKLSEKGEVIPQSTLDELDKYIAKVSQINQKVSETMAAAEFNAEDKRKDTLPVNASFGGDNIGFKVLDDSAAKLPATLRKMKQDVADILKQTAVTVFTGMGEVIGGMLAGTSGIDQLPTMLLSALGGMLKQLGVIAIEAAIGLKSIKIAFETMNPAIALVAGIGLIALGTLIQSSTKGIGGNIKGYEKGGLFTNSAFINVAETSKARGGGGEWVTPVDKGASLIASQLMKSGAITTAHGYATDNPFTKPYAAMGGQSVVVQLDGQFKVAGPDLLLAINRAQRGQRTTGNG
ncbi:tape measure protein [Spirosoma pollinicola]|uniref:Tape measure protein N-terminal domain-containing protein n=1 Tax=Spirosoma pollinicola TaxID=2057025 RepID=A0A2K8ZB03_9BACT|nr:tape measure protein [Spirosoma pollinicola]AUD07010.1 hypothetical protein CWM47_37435 [Spirosoma pollinicola]